LSTLNGWIRNAIGALQAAGRWPIPVPDDAADDDASVAASEASAGASGSAAPIASEPGGASPSGESGPCDMNVYENVPLFPEFSNSTCYAGRLVSALCVEKIAATSWNNRRELAETHMASLNATVLAQDFTFDICKRIFVKDPDTNAQINPYNGLSIVMNENSQVVWCVFSLPRELFIDCSRGLRNAAPSKTP